MEYLPYRGKFLRVASSTMDTARFCEIDGVLWARRTTGNVWDPAEASDRPNGGLCCSLSTSSVLCVVDEPDDSAELSEDLNSEYFVEDGTQPLYGITLQQLIPSDEE